MYLISRIGAKYLKVNLKDSSGKKLFNKKSLVKQMILCIESVMPTKCEECSSSFKINLGDQPLFRCHICLRGSHNCEQLKKMSALLSTVHACGIVWLCGSCSTQHSGASPSIVEASPTVVMNTETSSSALQSEESDRVRDEIGSGTVASNLNAQGPTVVCKKYKKGNCPHGLRGNKLINGQRCLYLHPRSCNKFCSFGSKGPRGCSEGSSCQYFHPIICRFSLRSRQCSKENCSFVHLRGTTRKSLPVDEYRPASNNDDALNQAQSSTPSPFLRLESLIKSMDSRYQSQVAQLQSQLDAIVKSRVVPPPQPVDPMAYYRQQIYQHQQRPLDPYQVMVQGQGTLSPSYSQVVQGPMRDLNQRSTPPSCY